MVSKEDVVVFTAIFDGYDVLLDPSDHSEDTDYICFTDGSVNSDVWEERKVSFEEDLSHTMKNRKIKILPHLFLPDYKYSVYVDGNIEINKDIMELVDKYLSDNNLAVLDHPYRDCIYDEGQTLIEMGKIEAEASKEQLARYKREGMPSNAGLSENRILLREHNDPAVIELMENWWDEIQRGVERDQICFNYVAWKKDFNMVYMDEYPSLDRNSSHFSIHPHKPEGWKGKLAEYWIPLYVRLNIHYRLYYPIEVFRLIKKAISILYNEGPASLYKETVEKIKNYT